MKYYIVRRDALGEYGDQLGSDLAETVRLLAETNAAYDDLVVIYGNCIEPVLTLNAALVGESTEPEADAEYEGKLADVGLHGENAEPSAVWDSLHHGTIRGEA